MAQSYTSIRSPKCEQAHTRADFFAVPAGRIRPDPQHRRGPDRQL